LTPIGTGSGGGLGLEPGIGTEGSWDWNPGVGLRESGTGTDGVTCLRYRS
jgi:hypothetical protein